MKCSAMPGRAFLTDTVISEKMLSEVLSPGMGKRKAVAQKRLLAFWCHHKNHFRYFNFAQQSRKKMIKFRFYKHHGVIILGISAVRCKK